MSELYVNTYVSIKKPCYQFNIQVILIITCGERGIRTPGPVARTTVFKTAAFDHSAISPVFRCKSNIMLLIFNFYLEKYFKNDIFINYNCANYNKH